MGLNRGYGVLRGQPRGWRGERVGATPHFQLHLDAAGVSHRVAVTVRPARGGRLLYAVVRDLPPPFLETLAAVRAGFTRLDPLPGGLAIDYVRGGLTRQAQFRPLPIHRPGEGNDLNDLLEALTQEAREVFAFGEPWGPEHRADEIFGFTPTRGLHNVHMNQGSARDHAGENGVWQDGAILFARGDRVAALFLAFADQSWRTDKRGRPLSRRGQLA